MVNPHSLPGTTDRAGRDPIGIIEAQNRDRLQDLVPLRMARMSQSPFAFFRGTAALQAADLRGGPDSEHIVIACGDAHISNFGFFAAPDRTLVFDMNDFDEAAVAPWEWDLKRLSTSIVLAGRSNDFDAEEIEAAVTAAIGAPLILQMKEAGSSVLEGYGRVHERETLSAALRLAAPASAGERVVTTQRMLQAASDPFLGFVEVAGRGYYVRQFRDRNTSIDLDRLDAPALQDYVTACGRALARDHAQSPGIAFIDAYCGDDAGFDRAMLGWSLAYADQAEADYTEFRSAIDGGRFPVAPLV